MGPINGHKWREGKREKIVGKIKRERERVRERERERERERVIIVGRNKK